MLERIVEGSIRARLLVLIFAGLLAGAGVYAFPRLPIDAVPDITNVQVQVLTLAPALGPEEVESYITTPVERVMSGIPRMTEIRSTSRAGLSAVTVVFEDGTDIYWARQQVMERLPEAREQIPEGFGDPEMGPISTGLGEIYQFEVRGKGLSPMELRSILDWDIAYRLRTVPGVIEVNTFGGQLKTYEVQVDPAKLASYRLALSDVFRALEENNSNAGGAYLARAGEAQYIRGEGLIESVEDVEKIVVDTREDGTPIYVGSVGTVRFAPKVRQGLVSRDGKGETVVGIVMMLMGENSRAVVDRVKEKIEEIRATLPKGVVLDVLYDRTDLVRRTIRTVATNLTEGAVFVVVVLLLLLGNLRGGLMVALAIPLSMIVAILAMVRADVSGNLMSLGAIDFGLIVDGAVVMIENCFRRLGLAESAGRPRAQVVREACLEVARPVAFGVGIILVTYLPIFALAGVEGKMFRPMAFTVVFALAGSLVLALTLMPALACFFLKPASHGETFLIRRARRAYGPVLRRAMAAPGVVVSVAAAVFLASLVVASRLGAEFIPELDEGSIALQVLRLPSVSLEEAARLNGEIERTLLAEFPDEVERVVSKLGTAEIPTDPAGPEHSDILVMLFPRERWKRARTKTELVSKMRELLPARIPGGPMSFTQPIELRFSELLAGVRSDVAVKIYGDDLGVLKATADRVAAAISKVPGAFDVKPEAVAGLPNLRLRIDRREIARHGINVKDILDTVETLGGKTVGKVLEGQRRFDLQVRFAEEWRQDVERIRGLRVKGSRGELIPLSQLAAIWVEDGPAQISREKIRRRIAVEVNVQGRDLAGFVAEAKRVVKETVPLPPNYEVAWGGQFENLERAAARLGIVVPLSLLLIFVFLYTTFNAAAPAMLIYLNVPMAATGGIFALALRGMPFSISAGVGFIALFGVAVLNGLVLVSYIRQLQERGTALREAVYEGAMVRLRPVLMTALVASLGFVPMAVSQGDGAEVQRPLATVVIGGLVTSTLLTLLVLPTLYSWLNLKPAESPSSAPPARNSDSPPSSHF